MTPLISYLCVIQARLTSKRFPNKVMQTVGGKTMLRRVWDAAKGSRVDKIVVAWPERWPDIEEGDMYTKMCLLVQEFKPKYLVRLTADCPLLESKHINEAISLFEQQELDYYNNGKDGYDVQVFKPTFMYQHPNKEHVLQVAYNYGGYSVNTKEDLKRIRSIAR